MTESSLILLSLPLGLIIGVAIVELVRYISGLAEDLEYKVRQKKRKAKEKQEKRDEHARMIKRGYW